MRYNPVLLCVFSACMLSACNALYLPAVPEVPLHEKKNDLRVAADIGATGVTANASWSMARSFYAGGNVVVLPRLSEGNKHFAWSGYAGVYRRVKERVHFDAQAGYGEANLTWEKQDIWNNPRGYGWYSKLFGQVAAAFNLDDTYLGMGYQYAYLTHRLDGMPSTPNNVYGKTLYRFSSLPFLFLDSGDERFRVKLTIGISTVDLPRGDHFAGGLGMAFRLSPGKD